MVPVSAIATEMLLVFTVGYFLSPYTNVNAKVPNCPKYCTCWKRLNVMKPLSYMLCGPDTPPHTIPRAPPNINVVKLEFMNLGYITKEMTRNLTFCRMTQLWLKKNNITGVSEDAFKDIRHLKILSLARDDFQVLKMLLLNQGGNLRELYLRLAKNYVFEPSLFIGLRNLKTLGLNGMGLETFDVSVLSAIDTLRHLDLTFNRLADIKAWWCLPKLTNLTLSRNDLTHVPKLCTENTTSTITSLDLSYNKFTDLKYTAFACFKELEVLDISGNFIAVLKDNVFAYLPNFFCLYISRMPHLHHINEFAFNSSSLRRLYFTKNQHYIIFKNHRTLFKYAPNLELLDLSGTFFPTTDVAALFQNLKNIKVLMLRHVFWKTLLPDLFQKMTHLTDLDLSFNNFSPWNKRVFQNVSSIRTLHLRNCQIQALTEDNFPLGFRLNLKKIDLTDNPFRCTCDLLWFKTWMDEVVKNKSIRFLNRHKYKCYKHVPVKRLSSFHPTAALCRVKDTYIIFLTTILSLVLALIVSGLVIYRYRWYLLYWISLLRRRKQKDRIPVELRYDGFVSHSNNDLDWVMDELVAFLEEQVGLKLCEHRRDFQPGYIVDNVIEAVYNSRKTILVISNEYMKSAWCQFELNMVFSSYLKNEIDIVVILLEHIEACHVTSSLRALMVSTTYLEWSDEEEARRLFREKIKNAMRDRA